MASGRKALKKKCDKLWSEKIRGRGSCERCGKNTGLQAAHIISRRYARTRHMTENGMCLCLRCHLYWAHKEPDQFTDWVRSTRGRTIFEWLRERAQSTDKVDYEEVYKKLKETK